MSSALVTFWRKLLNLLSIGILFVACTQEETVEYQSFVGETMGTYYSIKMSDVSVERMEIDSILLDFSKVFSTYDDQSIISKINASKEIHCFVDKANRFWLFIGNSIFGK